MKQSRLFRRLSVLFTALIIVSLTSCEYEFIEVTPPAPEPGDTVSFSQEVEPIFEASTCTNCHNGGLPLVLTAGNAYQSIMDLGLAIPGDPENSKIYYYPHPVNGSHGTRYSSIDDANKVYNWISQGALNN
ncbi:MAG: hypothetical protein Kow00127_14300 [Bacteroidales bacterium]